MFKTSFYFILVSLFLSGAAFAQNYEILVDTFNSSGWYGGDDRPCCGPRNVAVAQSVTIEEPINLESFSFYFTNYFDFAYNPTGSGVEVTLRLHIRDSLGTVLQTEDVVVPDTFTGGWVSWTDINLDVNGPAKYIFSTYLVEGYDSIQVNSGQGCDSDAGYPGGERFTKHVVNDSDAVSWDNWLLHSWDCMFWLTGTMNPTSVSDNEQIPEEYVLNQNYPNPFNPTTVIQYTIPSESFVELVVINSLGENVATLVKENQQAGSFNVYFNASGLPSGVYFYRIIADNFTRTKKMMLIK